jgi:hypothetical protein
MLRVRFRNHLLWLGPLVTLAGALSYFLYFARFPVLRDFPWVNLPLVLCGLALSAVGLWRAVRERARRSSRILGGIGLAVSAGVALLFNLYVFFISYAMPGTSDVTRALERAPSFRLTDQDGRSVALEDYRGRKLVVVFFRGFW